MGGFLGSSSSKSSKDGTVTSTQEPWSGVQPALKAGIGEAMNLYNSGGLPQAWQGSSVVPFLQQQMQGLGGIESAAQQGNPLLSGAIGSAQGVLNGGGLTAGQQGNLGNLAGVASGAQGINTGGQYGDVYSGLGGNSSSGLNLADYASGGMVGQSNPHLMGNLATAAGKASDAVNSTFSGAGRYGSGAHQGTVGETVGNIYSQGLGAQMNTDIQNQFGAANQIDQARLGQASGQLSALQGLTAAQSGNIANRVGAAGMVNDVYSQGNQQALQYGALAPALNEMRYGDSQKLFDVGGVQQGQLQQQLNDKIRVYDANQARPMENVNWLSSLLGGTAGYGNTQTSSTPQGSMLSGALGGAAMGGGILGSMYPQGGSPGWAQMLALGGGALGGAFM